MAGTNLNSEVNTTLWIRETQPVPAGSQGQGLAISAACTGAAPTTAGVFAHGCIMLRSDTATGTKALYENVGSSAVPSWNLMGDVTAGEISLAEGSVLVGNSSGVATALNAKTNTQVLVGNGTTITSVALGTDVTMANTGAVTIANSAVTTVKINDAAVTRTKMSVPAGSKVINVDSAIIATTGDTVCYAIVPETGTLSSADFSGTDALAAHDTNYLTFSITNLGQAGAGSTVLLAATDANTTKATGGTAIVANGKRALTLTATPADLAVVQGDRLLIKAASAATAANTVSFPVYCLRFSGTT